MTKFYRTTISVEITTMDRPAEYDERFWSHLRDSLADTPGTLQVGTELKSRVISRLEAEDSIEDLDDRFRGAKYPGRAQSAQSSDGRQTIAAQCPEADLPIVQ